MALAVLTQPGHLEQGDEPAGVIKAWNILIGRVTINFSNKDSTQCCSLEFRLGSMQISDIEINRR